MAYENYTQNSEGFVGFSGHLEHFNPQFGIVKLGDNRATGFGVFAGFTGTDAGSTRHVVNLPPGLRSSGYVAVIFENGEPVLKMYKGTALIAAGDTVTYNGTTATAASFIGFPSDTHWQDPSYWVTVEGGTTTGGGIDFQDEDGNALGDAATATLQITGTANEVEVTSGVSSDIATYTIGLPDNVLIAGTLGVTGAASLTSTLSVNGVSTFNADVDLENNNILDVRNIELTAISPRTATTDINFNLRNGSENALEFVNADNPGVVYMSIRTTQSNLDGVHIDRDFYIDNLTTSLSADVIVKNADGKLFFRTLNPALLSGGDINVTNTDLSAQFPMQLTGAASNVISIADNHFLRKNINETTTGTFTAAGLRTSGNLLVGATGSTTFHRDSLPIANQENFHLLMIDDEQVDGEFTDRVKRKQVFATGIFNSGGLNIQSDTDLVAGQNLSFGQGTQANVLNVEDVVRTDLTTSDYQFVKTPLKVGSESVTGNDAIMQVTNVVPNSGTITTRRFLELNDGSGGVGSGANVFKRMTMFGNTLTSLPALHIASADTDSGIDAPFIMTDGGINDFSGMGSLVAMHKVGFGDLSGSGGNESVFEHYAGSNSDTRVFFSGFPGETTIRFGGGTAAANTTVVVGPHVNWNFQGTVTTNNTVGTTVNVPYHELGANTTNGTMPMGIFDTYQDHAGNSTTARSFAILPVSNNLQLGTTASNTPLIQASGNQSKQQAEIFVASSVTDADTNSPDIGTKEFLPTVIGALKIQHPLTNAYSSLQGNYQAATPFAGGFAEGILNSMVLTAAQSQLAQPHEAHLLPTVSAVRELVDSITVTPFSTSEEFRTLNYGLGTTAFTGTSGADETFTGVPSLEVFSDTGSNAYDDASSNALTNNEAIVVKTSSGFSHINPIGLGLALQDDFTANRPAAIGFLTGTKDIFKGTSLRAVIDMMLRPPLQTTTEILYNGSADNVFFESGYQVDNQYVVQVGSVENAGPGPTLSDATLTVSKTTSNLALASTATGVEGTSASVTTTGTWLGGATSGTVNVPLDLDESGEIAQASNPVIVGSNTSLEGFFKLTATVPNLDASQASEVDTHQINVVHRSFVICSDFDWATSILAGTLTPASTYGDGNTYFAADGTTSSVTQGTGTNAAGHVWIAAAQGEADAITSVFTPITGGASYQSIDGSETSFSNLEHRTPSTAGGATTDLATYGGRLMPGGELRNPSNNDMLIGNFFCGPTHNGGNNFFYLVVPASLFTGDSEAVTAQFQTSGGFNAGIKIVMNANESAPADFFYTNQYGIQTKYTVFQGASPGSHPITQIMKMVV